MSKRIVVVMCIVLLLSACGGTDLKWPKELYNKVEFVSVENEQHYVIYQNAKYYLDDNGFFQVTESHDAIDENDVRLGWNGKMYKNDYYSNTQEQPIFIYNLRLQEVYFREGYNYRSDLFIIEGTDSKICFSDAIVGIDSYFDSLVSGENEMNITLRSETNPRVCAPLELFSHEGIWYVRTHYIRSFRISNEFITLLMQNGIICEE